MYSSGGECCGVSASSGKAEMCTASSNIRTCSTIEIVGACNVVWTVGNMLDGRDALIVLQQF